MTLHEFLDFDYGVDGDNRIRQRLAAGEDPNVIVAGETALHVAARRRRGSAVIILLDHGAEINATNRNGKSAYVHALRRGFEDIVEILVARQADTTLSAADQLAVAVVTGQFDDARALIARHPHAIRTGNPEEDRLLADVAGRNNTEAVAWLIETGVDLTAPALDSGTPLHQAAWFGQPQNAGLLIDAGAPLDIFDAVHKSSPLGWAVHGSRFSGGAENRHDVYLELVKMLLDAGSSVQYPGEVKGDAYLIRLRNEATPLVKKLLPEVTRT